MDFKNLLSAKNRDELRQWLSENYNTEGECWVVVKRGRPVADGTFWYIDAVEEAMCFGWIDSTTKKMDNGITAQRLAPRRKGSLWSVKQGALPENGTTGAYDRCGQGHVTRYVRTGICD